jgi:hypothetical protein
MSGHPFHRELVLAAPFKYIYSRHAGYDDVMMLLVSRALE